MRRLLGLLGTSLIFFGFAIVVGIGGFFAYEKYEEYQFIRTIEPQLAQSGPITPAPTIQWVVSSESPTGVPTESATPEITRATSPTVTVVQTATAGQPAVPTKVPSPTPYVPILSSIPSSDPLFVTHFSPTPVLIYPAIRIVAPSIKLDSPVVESPIVDGFWQVPKFVAGHLQGTAEPLQNSNVVLSGHVESLSSGNVFANIGDLKPGDQVKLFTSQRTITYVVRQRIVVDHHDIHVVFPTPSETLTLITCTGNWLPLEHDFDQRIVVVAQFQSNADSGGSVASTR